MSGRISQRIVVAVIGSLPCTLEVFCRHAGPSASVVHALATLREDYFDAVGPERRLTPFGPIRIRTVICKGDGFFDRLSFNGSGQFSYFAVSYTHLRAHETGRNLVCRLLLEK